jgi:hypothetical protein
MTSNRRNQLLGNMSLENASGLTSSSDFGAKGTTTCGSGHGDKLLPVTRKGFVGTRSDITTRVNIEKELELHRQHLQHLQQLVDERTATIRRRLGGASFSIFPLLRSMMTVWWHISLSNCAFMVSRPTR